MPSTILQMKHSPSRALLELLDVEHPAAEVCRHPVIVPATKRGLHAAKLCCMAETHFDDWIARHYRELWPEVFKPALLNAPVAVLAELAGSGRALEFGVGTGRIAVPLNAEGVGSAPWRGGIRGCDPRCVQPSSWGWSVGVSRGLVSSAIDVSER